ncbi:MAG: hypothetical protein Q4D62_11775 [Planctomycetia bacterium]|nr:hypothetical protein [Planctomycetia bacterium]
MYGTFFSRGVALCSILWLWSYGNLLTAQTEPVSSSISSDISELSSESIKTITDLYENEELELQRRSPTYHAVPGGDGDTPESRLYTILLMILGGMILLGIGIFVSLNILLARVAKRIYETRVGTLEDDEEET